MDAMKTTDTPYGHWYEALETVARTLRPDAPEAITSTKAIRKAVLLPDESVRHYMVQMEDETTLMLTLLTASPAKNARLVRVRFMGDAAQHLAVPTRHIHFLGGEFGGTASGTTEVWGLLPVAYHFLLDMPPEPLTLVLPTAPPNSVGGMEQIAFAQALLAAISGE